MKADNGNRHATRLQRKEKGFVLLDALIAILIFSVGILGMVAMQGTAVKLAGDAKYRSDAAMLVDQVIAQMWGSNLTTVGPLSTAYAGAAGTGGAGYTAWVATLDCASGTASTSCLPGADANPPTIAVSGTNLVTVTVYWKSPNDTGIHNYASSTQLTR
jgi:type IV pilus assembly protein PilV